MVRHDRRFLKWTAWLPALTLLGSPPASAQNIGVPDDPLDTALREAATAREEGNCLAHGNAVIEAKRLLEAWIKGWGPVETNEEAFGRAMYAGALRDMVAAEGAKPCGDAPPDDAVMADIASDTPPVTPQDPPPGPPPEVDRSEPYRAALAKAMNEAREAREAGNCLAHGAALNEAQKVLAEWGQAQAFTPRLSFRDFDDISGYSRLIKYESELPCGDPLPDDAVMADLPSETLPGMGPAAPADLQPVLDIHNAERAAVGAAPLAWSAGLQASATKWAEHLSTIGRLEHAPREGRGIERENLLQALPDWSIHQMLDLWVSEKKDFVAGVFPDVSQTGDVTPILHYTQMIWPGTTELGCGLIDGDDWQWLVCRYSPGGNRDGESVGVKSAGGQAASPGATIRFDRHRSSITPEAAVVLDGAIEEYKRTGRAAIDMTADDDVGAEFRLERRYSVGEYLTSHGVPYSALDTDIDITYDGY